MLSADLQFRRGHVDRQTNYFFFQISVKYFNVRYMTEKNGIPDQIFWVFMDDLRQGEFDTFLLLCKESLNTLYSDGQQFSQYQQKRIFTSHFKSFNTKKS